MKRLLFSLALVLGLLPLNVSAYTVQKGDVLSKIANRYNTTVQEIAQKNNISNPNRIYTGQHLNINDEVKVGGNVYIPPKNNGVVSSTGGIFTNVTSTNGNFEFLTIPNFTEGSIIFASSGGLLSQDNSNLFYDDTNNWIGIGTSAPSSSLHNLGYSTFGEFGIPVKDYYFTATSCAAMGGWETVTLTGIENSKITKVDVILDYVGGGASSLPPNYTNVYGYLYSWQINGTTDPTFYIECPYGSSLYVVDKAYKVHITYKN